MLKHNIKLYRIKESKTKNTGDIEIIDGCTVIYVRISSNINDYYKQMQIVLQKLFNIICNNDSNYNFSDYKKIFTKLKHDGFIQKNNT